MAANDEFLNIKNPSRYDMLAVHRAPQKLMGMGMGMGIMPHNTCRFDDIEKARKVFVRNQLNLLQKRFEKLNEWLNRKIMTFNYYEQN